METQNIKYYRKESGGIIRRVDSVSIYYLGSCGNWIQNQYLYRLFYDSMEDLVELTEEEIQTIITELKSKNSDGLQR